MKRFAGMISILAVAVLVLSPGPWWSSRGSAQGQVPPSKVSSPLDATPTPTPSPSFSPSPSPSPSPTSKPSPSPSPTPVPAPVESWVARYKGPSGGPDYSSAIAVDGSGNVYVTGYSDGGANYDYATVKYNSSGVQQWAARYNGPGNGDDQAKAIAVDGSGNVYVTGYSEASASGRDYATIKYNSSGVQQWVVRYDGPGNRDDEASAIALDASGNVYVTGYSDSKSSGYDDHNYATIKYNSGGVQQWVARYVGPAGSIGGDYATAIAVDGSGNVYVTGRSDDNDEKDDDYATVKYNSSGVQQWVARYDGPLGGWADSATAIAVDGSGNVYVTGYSDGVNWTWDYATIKYDSGGVRQWVARYDGPSGRLDYATAIALDGSGNVYVTGYSHGDPSDFSRTDYDYATIKYNSSGVQQWVARYKGPGNKEDMAQGVAVDASGNVYVTGSSRGGANYYDYATVKYNSSGVEQWVARYNGPGNGDDVAAAIAVDGSGNVYVAGYSDGGTNYDYAAVKYNSSGVEQWVARYNGPGNGDDVAYAIAVDGSASVYVTGHSDGSGTNRDYATIKYNSGGVQQWVARYSGPGNGDDRANGIAVDGSGNTYVTGYSDGGGANYDYATVKYNDSGVQQWVARYNGPGNRDDEASAIALDPSGNVYVTGYSDSASTSYYNHDYATVKYNSGGIQQWVARYNGPGNGSDQATAVGLDGSGNVYVTGYSDGGAGYDYATVKYNSGGVQQWVARYNGPANSYDGASAIAVDGSGNVYVTGASDGGGTYYDYATVKYDSSGVQQWVARYHGGFAYDYATAIALDASGNVYVTGYSEASASGRDYATVKYNSSGVQQWVVRYTGPSNRDDHAQGVAVDGSGNVYVTGNSDGGMNLDYATVKYAPSAGPTPTPSPSPSPSPSPTPSPTPSPSPSPSPTSPTVAPAASFTKALNPANGVAPCVVTFTDMSTNSPSSWFWDFGDGTSSTQQNPVKTYNTDGNFKVILLAANAAGSRSASQTVSIYSSPAASFTASATSANPSGVITFSDQSTGNVTSWSWNFGDGTGSSLQNPSKSYVSTGNYTVVLTASNPAGSHSLTKTNYINVTSSSFSLQADLSLTPVLSEGGYAAVRAGISRLKNAATGESHAIGDGIGAYDASVTYTTAGVITLSVAGLAPFASPTVDLNTSSGTRTTFNANQTGSAPAPPLGLADLRLRLKGDKDTTYTVTLSFNTISRVTGGGMAQTGPSSLSFKRGDVNSSGTVTITDALFIAQYLAGLRALGTDSTSVNPVSAASVKQDIATPDVGDKITITDALLIAQMLAGLRDAAYNLV